MNRCPMCGMDERRPTAGDIQALAVDHGTHHEAEIQYSFTAAGLEAFARALLAGRAFDQPPKEATT